MNNAILNKEEERKQNGKQRVLYFTLNDDHQQYNLSH